MKIFKEYHICRTGKLKQHYTLYISRFITHGNHFFNNTCSFQQNLGYDENQALNKVQEMIKSDPNSTIDFCDSKRREYCDLKAFGFEWEKTPKGFITNLTKYCISPKIKGDSKIAAEKINNTIANFWQVWRKKKSIMKEQGFSVFKINNQFKLFFRNCPNEEMYSRMEILNTKVESTGNYIGEIGVRLKGIPVTIEKVQPFKNDYTDNGQQIWFRTEDKKRIITKYSGSKYIVKEKESFLLSGTIKTQDVFDSVKTTIINRIILK